MATYVSQTMVPPHHNAPRDVPSPYATGSTTSSSSTSSSVTRPATNLAAGKNKPVNNLDKFNRANGSTTTNDRPGVNDAPVNLYHDADTSSPEARNTVLTYSADSPAARRRQRSTGLVAAAAAKFDPSKPPQSSSSQLGNSETGQLESSQLGNRETGRFEPTVESTLPKEDVIEKPTLVLYDTDDDESIFESPAMMARRKGGYDYAKQKKSLIKRPGFNNNNQESTGARGFFKVKNLWKSSKQTNGSKNSSSNSASKDLPSSKPKLPSRSLPTETTSRKSASPSRNFSGSSSSSALPQQLGSTSATERKNNNENSEIAQAKSKLRSADPIRYNSHDGRSRTQSLDKEHTNRFNSTGLNEREKAYTSVVEGGLAMGAKSVDVKATRSDNMDSKSALKAEVAREKFKAPDAEFLMPLKGKTSMATTSKAPLPSLGGQKRLPQSVKTPSDPFVSSKASDKRLGIPESPSWNLGRADAFFGESPFRNDKGGGAVSGGFFDSGDAFGDPFFITDTAPSSNSLKALPNGDVQPKHIEPPSSFVKNVGADSDASDPPLDNVDVPSDSEDSDSASEVKPLNDSSDDIDDDDVDDDDVDDDDVDDDDDDVEDNDDSVGLPNTPSSAGAVATTAFSSRLPSRSNDDDDDEDYDDEDSGDDGTVDTPRERGSVLRQMMERSVVSSSVSNTSEKPSSSLIKPKLPREPEKASHDPPPLQTLIARTPLTTKASDAESGVSHIRPTLAQTKPSVVSTKPSNTPEPKKSSASGTVTPQTHNDAKLGAIGKGAHSRFQRFGSSKEPLPVPSISSSSILPTDKTEITTPVAASSPHTTNNIRANTGNTSKPSSMGDRLDRFSSRSANKMAVPPPPPPPPPTVSTLADDDESKGSKSYGSSHVHYPSTPGGASVVSTTSATSAAAMLRRVRDQRLKSTVISSDASTGSESTSTGKNNEGVPPLSSIRSSTTSSTASAVALLRKGRTEKKKVEDGVGSGTVQNTKIEATESSSSEGAASQTTMNSFKVIAARRHHASQQQEALPQRQDTQSKSQLPAKQERKPEPQTPQKLQPLIEPKSKPRAEPKSQSRTQPKSQSRTEQKPQPPEKNPPKQIEQKHQTQIEDEVDKKEDESLNSNSSAHKFLAARRKGDGRRGGNVKDTASDASSEQGSEEESKPVNGTTSTYLSKFSKKGARFHKKTHPTSVPAHSESPELKEETKLPQGEKLSAPPNSKPSGRSTGSRPDPKPRIVATKGPVKNSQTTDTMKSRKPADKASNTTTRRNFKFRPNSQKANDKVKTLAIDTDVSESKNSSPMSEESTPKRSGGRSPGNNDLAKEEKSGSDSNLEDKMDEKRMEPAPSPKRVTIQLPDDNSSLASSSTGETVTSATKLSERQAVLRNRLNAMKKEQSTNLARTMSQKGKEVHHKSTEEAPSVSKNSMSKSASASKEKLNRGPRVVRPGEEGRGTRLPSKGNGNMLTSGRLTLTKKEPIRGKKPASILKKPLRRAPGSLKSDRAGNEQEASVMGHDPVERAGQRLLSAAAVPIQAQIRCFIMIRKYRLRKTTLLKLQAYMRRWLAEIRLREVIDSTITIQSTFRGWLTRDNLEDERYCATQIQRIVRGYFATLRVYEDMYNVTVVQSLARRKLAINEATYRLYSIVLIQSSYRSFKARTFVQSVFAAIVIQCWFRRYKAQTFYEQEKAAILIQKLHRGVLAHRDFVSKRDATIVIQKMWRGYSAQLNFQFDIVDIIIVQSVYRRKVARGVLQKKQHDRMMKSATIIQTQWRAYDSMMNYLHTMADILIVQSVVRRWIAARFVPRYRAQKQNKASTLIQSRVRGMLAQSSYKRFLAARSVQTKWRQFIAQKKYIALKAEIAAKELARKQREAVIQIQRVWRGFQCYTDFIFVVADVVIVQSTARQWLAKRKLAALRREREIRERNGAATVIQKHWRGYNAHMAMLFTLVHIIVVQSVVRRRLARNIFEPLLLQTRAVTVLQKVYRGHMIRKRYTAFMSARKIQSFRRMHVVRRQYVAYVSARKIQAVWRSYLVRNNRQDAAVIIQKAWRGFVQYSNYLILRFEEEAAVTIQRYWRGFWQYSHYVILHFEVVRIQALVRGHQERAWLKCQHQSSKTIQTIARSYIARKEVREKKLIMMLIHSSSLAIRTEVACKKLQSWWCEIMQLKREKVAGLIIERFFIGVKEEVDREIRRRERNRQAKRERRQRKKREADENLLERVWLNTVQPDEEDPNTLRKAEEAAAMELRKQRSRDRRERQRTKSTPNSPPNGDNSHLKDADPKANSAGNDDQREATKGKKNTRSRRSGHSPSQQRPEHQHAHSRIEKSTSRTGKRGGREELQDQHNIENENPPEIEYDNAQPHHSTVQQLVRSYVATEPEQPPPPTQTVDLHDAEVASEVSGITAPTIFLRQPAGPGSSSRFATLSRKELSDDLSLEEAWIDAEIHQVKEKRKTDVKYIQRHGLSSSTKKPSSRSESPAVNDHGKSARREARSNKEGRRSRSNSGSRPMSERKPSSRSESKRTKSGQTHKSEKYRQRSSSPKNKKNNNSRSSSTEKRGKRVSLSPRPKESESSRRGRSGTNRHEPPRDISREV